MFLESLISALQHSTTALSNSSECSYYSCDHSSDYITTGSTGSYPGNLLGDGTVYPDQSAVSHHPTMLSNSTECGYYSCDHSADYIGTGSNGETNLTGDGVIYPEYAPFANGHTHMLASQPADHSGAFYCTEPEANCSTTVIDPVLKPIQYPVFNAAVQHPMLYQGADTSGAYYCGVPEANCSTTVVDPVLKPIDYPVAQCAALPISAPEQGDVKSVKPTPGHFLLMSNACILGAAEATSKLASNIFTTDQEKDVFSQWAEDFSRISQEAAGTVTPVGRVMLSNTLN